MTWYTPGQCQGDWSEDGAEYFPTEAEIRAAMMLGEALDVQEEGSRWRDRGSGRVRSAGSRPAPILSRRRGSRR